MTTRTNTGHVLGLACALAIGCSDPAPATPPAPAATATPPTTATTAPTTSTPAVSPTATTVTPSTRWLDLPNLASVAQGARLVRSDPEGGALILDEFAGTTWSRSDAQPQPVATAVIELAARARIDGVRLTLDDYWTVRLPNVIVVSIADDPAGPFREIARVTLPDPMPDTGDAHYLADASLAGAEGRYLEVRLEGRRGGPDEALGPFLSDVAAHGALLEPSPRETQVVGTWNGGWLLGNFEIARNGERLRVCFPSGREGSAVVDGRTLQLRWTPEDGGDAIAIVVRDADGHLRGTYQRWDDNAGGGEPATLEIESVDGEPSCAAAPARSAIEAALETTRRARIYDILFDTGSHTPRPESTETIDELASILTRHADWRVALEGHTDAIGDDASNQALSDRRAAAVRDALVTRGVDAARLTSAGLGETRPVATNDTAPGRAQNRRVEIALQ